MPQKVLVILLSEMGSLVLASPMFEYLCSRRKDIELYFLLFAQNREILEAVLGDMPAERILTVRNSDIRSFCRDSMAAVKRLRRAKIDAVIDCELFSRISSIFSRLSGAAARVGFERHTQEGLYRGSFINRPVLYSPHVHISRQFISLAYALEDVEVPASKRPLAGEVLVPKMFKAEGSELNTSRENLAANYPGVVGRKLVLLYPGGGDLPIRAWPRENFIELAKRICGGGHAVGIIGMERDRALASSIVEGCAGASCVDMTGYTRRMRDLLLLFHNASLLITNDGGPGHFAAMTPLPAVILYGPETPVLYGSLSPRAECLYAAFSCSPCLTAYNFRTSPCNGNNLCLKQLTVDEVWGRAAKVLKGL